MSATDLAMRAFAYWQRGGLLMLALAALSIGIWFYFMRSRRELSAVTATAVDFDRCIAAGIRSRPWAAVANDCRAQPGALAAAVAYALDAGSRGEAPDLAFVQYEKAALAHLGRDVVVLTALTAAAPLLGLLGTVGGMVQTFHGVAAAAGDMATRVSDGVSQALVTTQFGLVVAIPGILLVGRVQRLLDRVEVRFATCHSHLRVALDTRANARSSHATPA